MFKVQNTLSIDAFGLEDLIRFYPNPLKDNLNLLLTNINEDVDYQIFNTLGQRIGKGNLASNKAHIIDMSYYQSGIYFVNLKASSNPIVRKVIKN